jgi:ubiquinone/menaquinone biosynthesis C-methylase UbiE
VLIPERRPSRERLDDPNLPSEEMARSLQDVDLVNRRWGGSRAVANHLLGRLQSTNGSPVRILDVGAGSGAVARRLAEQLREAGQDARVVASDLQWRHLAAGRGRSATPLPAAAADAFGLPFPARSFDWTISTLLFHHYTPEQNVRMLRELARVSRHGFAILDLRRHVFPLLFVEIAGRFLFRSRVSLEDGAASVRQAYTPAEALAIARDAVPDARVEKVFPFRLLIWKNGSGSP